MAASLLIWTKPKFSAMLFGDTPGDGEAESGGPGFRRKQGFKNPGAQRRRDAGSRVANVNLDVTAALLGFDAERAVRAHGLNGV